MTAAPVPVPASIPLPRPMAAPRRRLSWLIVIGIWTILPVLQALQAAFYAAYLGHPIEWDRLLPIRLADWYTCALFTPVCFARGEGSGEAREAHREALASGAGSHHPAAEVR